jgi:hypothetical protein
VITVVLIDSTFIGIAVVVIAIFAVGMVNRNEASITTTTAAPAVAVQQLQQKSTRLGAVGHVKISSLY